MIKRKQSTDVQKYDDTRILMLYLNSEVGFRSIELGSRNIGLFISERSVYLPSLRVFYDIFGLGSLIVWGGGGPLDSWTYLLFYHQSPVFLPNYWTFGQHTLLS